MRTMADFLKKVHMFQVVFFFFWGGVLRDEIRERLRISHVLIGFQMIYLDWCGQFLARIHAFKHSWVNFTSMSPDAEAMSSGCPCFESYWRKKTPSNKNERVVDDLQLRQMIWQNWPCTFAQDHYPNSYTEKKNISGTPTTPSFLR